MRFKIICKNRMNAQNSKQKILPNMPSNHFQFKQRTLLYKMKRAESRKLRKYDRESKILYTSN